MVRFWTGSATSAEAPLIKGGPIFGVFLCALFFGALWVLAKEGKKEATRTWRENRTLNPKRSAGLQNPKP